MCAQGAPRQKPSGFRSGCKKGALGRLFHWVPSMLNSLGAAGRRHLLAPELPHQGYPSFETDFLTVDHVPVQRCKCLGVVGIGL